MSRAPLTTLALSFTCFLHACGADTGNGPARSNDALGDGANAAQQTDNPSDAGPPRDTSSAGSESPGAQPPAPEPGAAPPEDPTLPSEPPLNADPETGEVREGRCPLYADVGCPGECSEFTAGVVDLVQACHYGQRLVDCFAPGYGVFPGAPGCYVPADGLMYLTAVLYRPAGPSRLCTEEEMELSRSGLPECE